MKKLCICMISNLFPPAVSGSSTHVSMLSNELAQRGHNVVIITSKLDQNSKKQEFLNNQSIYRVNAFKLPKIPLLMNFPWITYTLTPRNLLHIKRIIKAHNPDIIHLHNHIFDLGLSAVLMKWIFKKPLVITIHTVAKHNNWVYNNLLSAIDKILLKGLILDQCNEIICPDLNIQNYAEKSFERKGGIIPYGIELKDPVNPEFITGFIRKYHLEGKRIILSLGHLHNIRNRRELIEALPRVLSYFPEVVLVVVGIIAIPDPLEQVKTLNLDQSVIFTGPLPHSCVVSLLSISDIEAHWLNQESVTITSLGIASLEAMAMGKAIISASNPDSYGKGVLQPGMNVVMVDPSNIDSISDAIIQLLEDTKKREFIGNNARKTIRDHFSWEKVCNQTLGLYNKCLSDSTN